MNAYVTLSLSNDTEICKKMKKEDKCYQSVVDTHIFNYACLSSDSKLSTNFCSVNPHPDSLPGGNLPFFWPETCPQKAKSTISFQQCYNTFGLVNLGDKS